MRVLNLADNLKVGVSQADAVLLGGTAVWSSLAPAAGYTGWWRADDLALSDGAAVSTWADLTGDYTLTSTGTGTPTYRTGTVNGHAVVEFDGVANRMTEDALATTDFASITDYNLFVVVNYLAVAAEQWAVTFGSSAAAAQTIGVGTNNATVRLHQGWVRTASGSVQLASAIPASVPGIVHLERGPSTMYVRMGLEERTSIASPAGTPAINRFTVGCLGRTSYANFANCQIAEIIAYPVALTAGEVAETLAYLQGRYSTGYVSAASSRLVGMTTDDAPATIATYTDIPSATVVREQDSIIHDPDDPNLGTYPEREWKHYYSVTFAGANRIYVVFSDDAGATWGAPVKCEMGVTDRISEDPAITTMFATPGLAHRNGDGDLVMYVEDKTIGNIYAYTSANGIDWTSLGAVIALGGGGTWDESLTGSPVPVFDGTNYIVGYEGISAAATEAFGIASGSDPAVLTKSAGNPVWTPAVAASIVVDAMVKVGSSVALLAHSGITASNTVFRGLTSVTDPTTWASGDITQSPANALYSVRNDLTLDFSDAALTTVISTDLADDNVVRYRLWGVAPWT